LVLAAFLVALVGVEWYLVRTSKGLALEPVFAGELDPDMREHRETPDSLLTLGVTGAAVDASTDAHSDIPSGTDPPDSPLGPWLRHSGARYTLYSSPTAVYLPIVMRHSSQLP